jgi:hypothetical protein
MKNEDIIIPVERIKTIRQGIIALLREDTLSAKELSSRIGISENEVFEHISHIQKKKGLKVIINPAKCRKCGFVFKREKDLKGLADVLCVRGSI